TASAQMTALKPAAGQRRHSMVSLPSVVPARCLRTGLQDLLALTRSVKQPELPAAQVVSSGCQPAAAPKAQKRMVAAMGLVTRPPYRDQSVPAAPEVPS